MSYNAKKVKDWCDKELTPLAWTRILMRHLPHFNQKGVFLHTLQNPTVEISFPRETYELISNTVKELYQREIPQDFTQN